GSPTAPPTVGAVLGRCKLVTEFARGANSLIFLAWHQTFKIDVVVKVLLPGAEGSPHALMLTANEAQVLARLGHPSIMRIFDFDDRGSFPYLAMEYVDGQSMARLISDRQRLDLATCLPIFAQCAEGLAFAHETSRVIHCDIKPDNLLIDKHNRVRIADFGLAGVPGTGQGGLHSQLAARGTVIGTPTYIAPELVEGGVARADQRSDIYSLGATLYHAITGRPPFADPDPITLMVKRLRELPPHPSSIHADVDRGLADLAMRMLATDPSARPQNHGEVLEGLTDLEDERSKVIRRRTSFWQYFSNESTVKGG
ncbi:MAG: serine/threonine-protein kinase, partial [Planctomycetota bacterium]